MDQQLPIHLLQASIQPSSTLSAPAAGAEGSGPAAGRWSPREDQLLRDGVQAVGQQNWKKISDSYLNGRRTDVQCLHRWQKVLKPGLRKGKWTQIEDDTIRSCIEQGMTQWKKIADAVPGRIGKQCRERYYNHLDPAVKKTPWTEEEDKILDEAQAEYGNKWTIIAKLLPGRPENTVKNRWNSSHRRRDREQRGIGMNGESLTSSAADCATPNKSRSENNSPNTNDSKATRKAIASASAKKSKGRKRPWNALSVDTELVLKSCSINSPSAAADFTCGQQQSQLLTGPQLTGSLLTGVCNWEGTISQKLKLEIDTTDLSRLNLSISHLDFLLTSSPVSSPTASSAGTTDDEDSPVPTDDEDYSQDAAWHQVGSRRVKFKLEMPSEASGGEERFAETIDDGDTHATALQIQQAVSSW
jgi:hypothetical protein